MKSADNVIAMDFSIKKMQKLLDENPDIGDDLASFIQASYEPGVKQQILNKFVSPQDRTAAELMLKYANELVLNMDKSGQGSRVTDMQRSMQAATKGGPAYSRETNKTILENLKKLNDRQLGYIHQTSKGFGKWYTPPPTELFEAEDRFEDYEGKVLSGANRSAGKTVKVMNNETGQYEYLTEEEARKEGIIK